MVSGKESLRLFDGLLFPKIFQTFRMSIQPTKLIITFLALALICLVGWIMDFSRTVAVARDSEGEIVMTELQIYMTNADRSEVHSGIEGLRQGSQHSGVFSTMWHFAAKKFQGAVDSVFAFDVLGLRDNIADYFRAVGWALRYHFAYSIIFFSQK